MQKIAKVSGNKNPSPSWAGLAHPGCEWSFRLSTVLGRSPGFLPRSSCPSGCGSDSSAQICSNFANCFGRIWSRCILNKHVWLAKQHQSESTEWSREKNCSFQSSAPAMERGWNLHNVTSWRNVLYEKAITHANTCEQAICGVRQRGLFLGRRPAAAELKVQKKTICILVTTHKIFSLSLSPSLWFPLLPWGFLGCCRSFFRKLSAASLRFSPPPPPPWLEALRPQSQRGWTGSSGRWRRSQHPPPRPPLPRPPAPAPPERGAPSGADPGGEPRSRAPPRASAGALRGAPWRARREVRRTAGRPLATAPPACRPRTKPPRESRHGPWVIRCSDAAGWMIRRLTQSVGFSDDATDALMIRWPDGWSDDR